MEHKDSWRMERPLSGFLPSAMASIKDIPAKTTYVWFQI